MTNLSFSVIFILFFLIYFPLQTDGQIIINKNKNIKKHHQYKKVSKRRNNILVSFDTVFNAGIPYCILKDRSTMFASDATVRTLTNKDVIQIYTKNNATVFELLEMEIMLYPNLGFANAKTISKFLVQHELLLEDGVNMKSLNRIKNQFGEPPVWSFGNNNRNNTPTYPSSSSDNPTFSNNETDNSGRIVERNRNGFLKARNGEITQSNQLIGTYTTEKEWNGSDRMAIHYIRYVDGSLCAKVTMKNIMAEDATVITQSNNRQHYVQKDDAFFDLNDVLLFLIKNLYL